MTMRAKFKVDSVTTTVNGLSAVLTPVTSGSEENKKFYQYTPGGKLELSIVPMAAADALRPGREFYIDFTPAD